MAPESRGLLLLSNQGAIAFDSWRPFEGLMCAHDAMRDIGPIRRTRSRSKILGSQSQTAYSVFV